MTRTQRAAVRLMTILATTLGAWFAPMGTSASASDVFALVGEENGNLDRLDLTTGTSTVISTITGQYVGLAWNTNETVLYGATTPAFESNTSLVTIDPATGVNTPVGPNGVALTTLTNLANGQLYGVGVNDNLYQINPTTGAATLIGPTGLPELAGTNFDNSLASNGTTLYYTLQTGSIPSTLYSLSLTTGAATAVGPTGASGIAGSAFAGPTFATGQLYGFLTNGTTDVINLTTGAATPLNSNGLTDIFGGVGIVTAATIPEPSTLVMALISGTMGLVYYAARRKRLP